MSARILPKPLSIRCLASSRPSRCEIVTVMGSVAAIMAGKRHHGCWRSVWVLFGRAGWWLDVVFDADPVDQVELRLDEIDLVLFALEHLAQHIPCHEIAHALAMRDPLAQSGARANFSG